MENRKKKTSRSTSFEIGKFQELNRQAWLQEKAILEEIIKKSGGNNTQENSGEEK